jgi:hypothetical protein
LLSAYVGSLFDLFINPEDGNSMFIWYVGLSLNYILWQSGKLLFIVIISYLKSKFLYITGLFYA